MITVFDEVRRVLRDDGTLWLNIGDSYAGSWDAEGRHKNANPTHNGKLNTPKRHARVNQSYNASVSSRDQIANAPKLSRRTPTRASGIKSKDLYGVPWTLAFALRASGWFLRQDIIWSKPNPMPESVTDRCTKSHEYIFLLSKSARYYYDAEAISEAISEATIDRLSQPNIEHQVGSNRVPGKTNGAMKAVGTLNGTRNKRSVWSVPTTPFKDAHFATFPPNLIEPCIRAGSPQNGCILDPFAGAGTTGLVADRLQRDAVLIELNPKYVEMARSRIIGDAPMFVEVHASDQLVLHGISA
jgi:DNA modification methylase